MDRCPPRVLAVAATLAAGLLVAVALSTGVAVSDGAANETPALDAGESPYLSPPSTEVTREEYSQPGLDLSAAAAADAQRLRGEHATVTFEERFEGASDPSAVVERAATDLGDRADALDDHHAGLIADYSAGETSTARLLGDLARASAAADQYQGLADRVETVVDDSETTLSQSTRDQLVALDRETTALESPVTDRLVTGGFDADTTVYAQATDDAVVIAVAGPTYTRQATLHGERDRGGVNQFFEDAGEGENPSALALDRAEQLYPEYDVFSPPPFDATTVYRVQGETEVGSFVAYLDGATRNIFHEQQRLAAEDLPVSTTLTDTAGAVELTVETTAPTGPMLVTVTDDGDPVSDATLQVDGDPVGTAGADGQRWVTQPLDGTVSVTVDEQTLQVTLPES